jgi:hypothetical protein
VITIDELDENIIANGNATAVGTISIMMTHQRSPL